ncbi:MAG TPA: hypothetical protein VKF42_03480, partial [Chitinivibrionales bacterium]|nr:hypothetical protein [Chitinivibrionales bacterium]
LVKGGDNDISLHVVNTASTFKGMAVVFSALLDTTQHFKPSGKYPLKQEAAAEVPAAPAVKDTGQHKGSVVAPAAKDTSRHKGAVAPVVSQKQEKAAAAAQQAPSGKTTASEAAAQPSGAGVKDTGVKMESAAQTAFNKKGAPAAARKKAPASVKYRNSKDVMNAILEYQKKSELITSDIKKEQLEVQRLKVNADDLVEQIRKVREETELLKQKPDQNQKPVEKQKPEANQKFDEKPKPK